MADTVDLRNKGLVDIPEELFEKTLTNAVKSLFIREGNAIPASHLYKMLDRLPNITSLDGQEISYIRNGIENLNKIFKRRLEEMFFSKQASKIYGETTPESVRINKMVALAKETIVAGPPLLKDFKDYKLDKFVREHYDKYVSDALEGKLEKGPAAKKAKVPWKGEQKAGVNTLLKLKSELKLSWLLQTHSKNNDPQDFGTKVWMCEFEPDIYERGQTSDIVATCGGDSICFINCETGLVHKKYREVGEHFYCIAYTVLTCRNSDGERKVVMLAGAGLKGSIKLIDTEKLVCYQRIMHHKKPVDSLAFHPQKPNWLLSGSEDSTIQIWDLGTPFINDDPQVKPLVTLEATTYRGSVRQVTLTPNGSYVFGATDDGLYVWNIHQPFNDVTDLFPEYKFKFTKSKQPLDSANCISDSEIAIKRVSEGKIMIFNSPSDFKNNDARLVHTLTWRKTDTPFLKFNFTPGCNILTAGDDQGMVWLYDLNDLDKNERLKVERLQCNNKYSRIFNNTSCSNPPRHVVAVSDTNTIAIWTVAV